MKRLPTEAALITSIDYSSDALGRIRLQVGDLLRRRRFEAGGDGYPTSTRGGGGGGSTGTPTSSTEVAALAPPMSDPVGRYIDDLVARVLEADRQLQRASNCLANVLSVDQELRGRVSTVLECERCEAPISGVGDDQRRSGLCPACYKSLLRWKPTAIDSTARPVFIAWRREKLAETPVPV